MRSEGPCKASDLGQCQVWHNLRGVVPQFNCMLNFEGSAGSGAAVGPQLTRRREGSNSSHSAERGEQCSSSAISCMFWNANNYNCCLALIRSKWVNLLRVK